MHPKSRLQTLRTPRAAADAKWLRRGMTDCEYRLWYYLRARRFQDRKFRRQVPMGPYIVDFLCEEVRLIVELDGGQHAERVRHDAARSEWLKGQGYRVLRFWNNEVTENIEGVLETLAQGGGGTSMKRYPSPTLISSRPPLAPSPSRTRRA